MTRSGIGIQDLPAHLQAKARQLAVRVDTGTMPRTIADGTRSISLGPDSPLHQVQPRAKRIDRESPMQIALFEWIDDPSIQVQYPELAAAYAIPNEVGAGGKQSARHRALEGAKKKAMGRRAGMPDLVLPTPRRDGPVVYGALYLEIKDESSGVVRKNQRDRIAILRAAGNRCDVAMSADAAKAIIIQYLNLSKP